MSFTERDVETAARAIWTVTGHREGDWVYMAPEDPRRQKYMACGRAAVTATAATFAANALEEAANELARLPYARPGAPERDEYERILAVRRGDTDKWLKDRATVLRGPE